MNIPSSQCPAAPRNTVTEQPLASNETQLSSRQSTTQLQQQKLELAPATPVTQDHTVIQDQTPAKEDTKPVTEAVTITDNVITASEPLEKSAIVAGGTADEVKQATVQSGHGVASDPLFQHRQPQTVSDPDNLKDEDYLIDRLTCPSASHADVVVRGHSSPLRLRV